MLTLEPWLIANQQQHSTRLRIEASQRIDARVDRARNSLLPVAIQYWMHKAQVNLRGDLFTMRAQHHNNRISRALADNADRSPQESFAGDADKLFRLAKAAACSSGENDCRHRHSPQFRTRNEIRLDLRVAEVRD